MSVRICSTCEDVRLEVKRGTLIDILKIIDEGIEGEKGKKRKNNSILSQQHPPRKVMVSAASNPASGDGNNPSSSSTSANSSSKPSGLTSVHRLERESESKMISVSSFHSLSSSIFLSPSLSFSFNQNIPRDIR